MADEISHSCTGLRPKLDPGLRRRACFSAAVRKLLSSRVRRRSGPTVPAHYVRVSPSSFSISSGFARPRYGVRIWTRLAHAGHRSLDGGYAAAKLQDPIRPRMPTSVTAHRRVPFARSLRHPLTESLATGRRTTDLIPSAHRFPRAWIARPHSVARSFAMKRLWLADPSMPEVPQDRPHYARPPTSEVVLSALLARWRRRYLPHFQHHRDAARWRKPARAIVRDCAQ